MYDKKEWQFIDWITGKNVPFPFLQNMPKVRRPVDWGKVKCPNCGKCDRSCDNCSYCLTDGTKD